MFLLASPIIKYQIIQITIVWGIISQSFRGSIIFFLFTTKSFTDGEKVKMKKEKNLIYILGNMLKIQQKPLMIAQNIYLVVKQLLKTWKSLWRCDSPYMSKTETYLETPRRHQDEAGHHNDRQEENTWTLTPSPTRGEGGCWRELAVVDNCLLNLGYLIKFPLKCRRIEIRGPFMAKGLVMSGER